MQMPSSPVIVMQTLSHPSGLQRLIVVQQGHGFLPILEIAFNIVGIRILSQGATLASLGELLECHAPFQLERLNHDQDDVNVIWVQFIRHVTSRHDQA